MRSHLCDTNASPLLFVQQLQGALGRVVVVLRNDLQHGLGQLDVAVFVFIIRVSVKQVRLAGYYGAKGFSHTSPSSGCCR